jgi:hypothetical protein
MAHRRRIYPMPVEGILDHPDAMALPSAGYGMLLRLVYHFWQTMCRPLPVSDDQLYSIARAHRPTWRRWKPTIMRVFEDIRPELEAYFTLREARRTTLRFAGQKGGQTSVAKLRAKALHAPDLLLPYASGFVPKREAKRLDRPPSPENRPPRKLMVDRPRF